LDKATIELDKLTCLVNGLRQFFGHQETKFEKINLVDTCETLMEFIEPTLRTNNISLIKRYVSSPLIIGNHIQLQQALINIFNNAIFSIIHSKSECREIVFEIRQKESLAIILIKDSGPGVDPEILPDIFELYKTSKTDGLGVGLWLCKTIVENHHGNITVKNENQSGAIFKIRIPIFLKVKVEPIDG
jgi:C4-dicarboxylate-specific signal transduction histidine kinase